MMDWLEEFLLVLAHSKRTQLAILLGAISFVVILAVGEYFVSRVNFQGTFAPLTDVAYSGERDRAFRLNVTVAHEMVLRG